MPVFAVGERPNSPRMSVSSDDIGSRNYTREFIVRCTTLADGPSVVLPAPGLPRLWQPFVFGNGFDQYALARTISCDRLLGGTPDWVVKVEYRTANKSEITRAYDNPLVQLPEVETSTEKYQMPVYFVWEREHRIGDPDDAPTGDYVRRACRASNSQVFDPPPMRDLSRVVLTITRNESISLLHPSIDLAYSDALNADVFWDAPPGTWKCQGITTRREVKQLWNGVLFPYLRCTYRFEARQFWDLFLLDAGSYYNELKTTGSMLTNDLVTKNVRLQFLTDDGHPTVGPLDGKGGRLPEGDNPVYKMYQIYQRLPFGALQLPQSFAQVA